MGLESYDSKPAEQKYTPTACEAADKLDDTSLSDGTLTTYKPQVRKVVSSLGKDPDPERVIDFIRDEKCAGSTKNVMVMAIKKYYQAIDSFGKSEKLSNLAEIKDLAKDYSSSMKVNEWVTKDEVEKILDKLCPDSDEKTKLVQMGDKSFIATQEHKAIVATLYYTGLRVSEAIMLEVDDFYFEDNEVEVYRLKKGGDVVKRDRIHQSDEYLDVIKDYMEWHDIKSGRIFDFTTRTVENRVNDIEEVFKYAYGGFKECENLTPHKFRHGRVTAIANTSGLEAASQYVDHESIETTQAYRHITTEDQIDMLPENQDSSDDVSDLLEELDVESVSELKDKLGDSN